jgi:ribosome-binding factor A
MSAKGKAPSQRQLRVGEVLRHALAELLARDEIRDPALDGVTVTVSEVSVSPDLKHAKAFVVPLGGGNQEQVVAALNRAGKFVRGRLGHAVQLKFTPQISFASDTSFAYSDRIGALFASPEVRRDLNDGPAPQDDTADLDPNDDAERT